MKKILCLLTVLACVFNSADAQKRKGSKGKSNEKHDSVFVTGSELIPIGGRSEGLPKGLEGTWVLSSGLKKTKPPVDIEKIVSANKEIERELAAKRREGPTETPAAVEGEGEARITPVQSDNLHEPEMPSISFYGLNETFSGFTGCNKYAGRYTLKGKKLTFKNPTASTRMVCLGEYDESAFLDALKKVSSFKTTDGELQLLAGDEVVLTFKKK